MTKIESFVASCLTEIALPIFQSLWGTDAKSLGFMGKTLDMKTQQLIYAASGEYGRRYFNHHSLLKALGIPEAMPLESVYTAVQFLDEQPIHSFEAVPNLQKAYRQAQERNFQYPDCHPQAGLKIANQNQYLMLLGEPGAGKSTFLRQIGLEALKGKQGGYQQDSLPVFIELQSLTSSQIEIEKVIIEKFKNCGFPASEQFIAKALEQGKFLILLDGLDEVPTINKNEVMSNIENFVGSHDKNRFIFSCRTAAYRNNFKRFINVKIADCDDSQIQQFIANWFKSEVARQPEMGQKCWELLQKPEYAAAKELARTPLLLSLLCLTFDRSQNLPNNRSLLYKQALQILLEAGAASKRILPDEIYQGLSTELEEILLSEIAYTGFETDQQFFSVREVVEPIKTFLASNLNVPKHLDGEALLNAIALQQGILVKRAENLYSFSHRTLQEYLTAQYIADRNLIQQLVTCHLSDSRWREVFLLVAGLLPSLQGADGLLLLMEKEAQKYINTPKLQRLLQWADAATNGSEGDFKPVGKRAAAIANACAHGRANANARANGCAITNAYGIGNPIASAVAHTNTYPYSYANVCAYAKVYSIALAEEFKKIQIFKQVKWTQLIAQLKKLQKQLPEAHQPQQTQLGFTRRLLNTWCNALDLDPEIVQLSQEEAKALADYLYANHLIVECKEAAVRISPKTWEEIESRMLLVPENSTI